MSSDNLKRARVAAIIGRRRHAVEERRARDAGHVCHAIGCGKVVPPRMLFCGHHWNATPRNLQRMIWATYREGQEITKTPSAVYLVAQAYVVATVAQLDQVWTSEQCTNHTMKTIERLIAESRLTIADFELLARFEPDVFGGALRRFRASRGET